MNTADAITETTRFSFANVKTDETPFDYIRTADTHLFSVRAGVAADFAISQAEGLDDAVRSLLTDAITEGSLGGDIAYLCRFALEAADALRRSAGVAA